MTIAEVIRQRLTPPPTWERPTDTLYALGEQPPAGDWAILVTQYAMTSAATLAYVLALAHTLQLSSAQTLSVISSTLIAMCIGTALQAWGGRTGSGLPLFSHPNPFFLTTCISAAAMYGPGAIGGVAILSGLISLTTGWMLVRFKAIFPPPVVGTIIFMGGVSLILPAVSHSLSEIHSFADSVSSASPQGGTSHYSPAGDLLRGGINPTSALISLISLVCMVSFPIWGGPRLRLAGLLAGIVAGTFIAWLTDSLAEVSALHAQAFFALPSITTPLLPLSPDILISIILVSTLSDLDSMGCAFSVQKLSMSNWRRPDLASAGTTIRGNGICDTLAGLIGSFPTGISSACLAITHATRSTSRYIGLAVAAVLLVLPFLPGLTAQLLRIPSPVMGAVQVYAAVILMVTGIEQIALRVLDYRRIFVVGLSILIGIAVMSMPALTADLPASLAGFQGNGFVATGLSAILLNLLFRIGIRQSFGQALEASPEGPRQAIIEFITTQASIWNVRRDVLRRATSAALEAIELIQLSGHGSPTEIHASNDDDQFCITLIHPGDPLKLQGGRFSLETARQDGTVKSDRDLDQGMMKQLSRHILDGLVDRISSHRVSSQSKSPAGSELRMLFDT